MKPFLGGCLAAMLALVGVSGARAEMVAIVAVSDMNDVTEYRIVTSADKKALDKEIADEAKVFPAALAEAKKEWATNKDNPPFPGNAVSARKISMKGSMMERSLAEKKKEKLDERLVEQLDKEKEKNKKEIGDSLRDKAAERKALGQRAAQAVAAKMTAKMNRDIPFNSVF